MIHNTEQNLLGLHNGQAGAWLVAQWQLPANFQEITNYQPAPKKAREHQVETSLLHVARGYARKYFCETGQTLEQLIIPDAWNILNLMPDQIESTFETAQPICPDMEKTILK